MASHINEERLREFQAKHAGKNVGAPIKKRNPKKKSVGRPRKHDPGSQRLSQYDMKYTFIADIAQILNMKSIAKKRKMPIKLIFAEAMAQYIGQNK